PPRSTLFPYTTLFRSGLGVELLRVHADDEEGIGRVLLFERRERGDGLHAVDAAARPEIEHHHAPREVVLRRRARDVEPAARLAEDRKSTRLNSSHDQI